MYHVAFETQMIDPSMWGKSVLLQPPFAVIYIHVPPHWTKIFNIFLLVLS